MVSRIATTIAMAATFLDPKLLQNRVFLQAQRERDKPRAGSVAISLNLFRNGAVGFIGWLGDTVMRSGITVIQAAPQPLEVLGACSLATTGG
jgi:hypothetical protein